MCSLTMRDFLEKYNTSCAWNETAYLALSESINQPVQGLPIANNDLVGSLFGEPCGRKTAVYMC